jgi:hypothetical protein
MNAQDTANHVFVRQKLTQSAEQLGLRRFISTTATISSSSVQTCAYTGAKTTCDTFAFSAGCGNGSGRLQNDGRTEKACRDDEQAAHNGDHTIRGAQVRRTLATSTENQQLMPDQHRFGNDHAKTSRPRQSGQGDDQMND